MAIALVQVKTATGTSGSPNLTLTSPSTAGTLLVAFCDTGQNSGNPTLTPPTNWTAETELVNQTFVFRNGLVAYYANNPGGISSITITASPAVSGGGWCLYVFEFSGVATTTPLDQEAQKVNSSGGGLASPSESITTTVAGDLVLGWAAGDAANGASSATGPASPWTNEPSIADVDGFERAIASYQVQTSAGSITYQPTFGGVTDYIIAIIAFKAAGGGGSIVSGSATLAANATLADAPNDLLVPSAPLPSNAALAETAAQLVSPAAPLAANAALGASAAQLVANAAPLVSNAGLSVTGQIVTSSAALVSNAALAETAAQVVEPSAALQSNAVLSATGGQVGQNLLIANAGLSVTATVVTPAAPPLAAYSILAEAAQIVAAAAPLASNAVLSASGTAHPPSQPGLVTASTVALTGGSATTARASGVTASNTAATLVTAGDV